MVSTGVQEEASDEDFNTPGGKSRQVRIHDFLNLENYVEIFISS